MSDIFEQLNKIDFEDDYDKKLFENYLVEPDALLVEMANYYGSRVKIEKIPFSFYISTKEAVHGVHAIRAKIKWNTIKMKDADGSLDLHGEYEYRAGSHKYIPTSRELNIAIEFFKKYKVLFSAVWEGKLEYSDLEKFLYGEYTIEDLLRSFDLSGRQYYLLNHCHSIEEAARCVRENKIFSMND